MLGWQMSPQGILQQADMQKRLITLFSKYLEEKL